MAELAKGYAAFFFLTQALAVAALTCSFPSGNNSLTCKEFIVERGRELGANILKFTL